jgi:hypothetical protein
MAYVSAKVSGQQIDVLNYKQFHIGIDVITNS